MSGKDVLEKMKRNELVLSMSLRVGMGNPSIEVARKLGFDYIYFDFEHGVLNVETFAQLVREACLAGIIALCRVPGLDMAFINRIGLDMAFINRILDAGTSGVVFPHIINKKGAMRAVEISKYRTPDIPFGKRGFEPTYGLPKHDYEKWEEYFKRMNEETLVGLMIEDKEGVDNIEEILSVKGIDFIFIGKMDMAFSYGVPFIPLAGRDHPIIEEAIAKVCLECKKRGIPVRFSVGAAPKDIVKNVKRWLSKGRSNLFMVNDLALLLQGAENYVNTLKKGLKKPPVS